MKIRTLLILTAMILFQVIMKAQFHDIVFENLTIEKGSSELSDELTFEANEVINGRYFRLIQFQNIPGVEMRGQLKDLGIDLIGYFPSNTYLASVRITADKDLLKNYDGVGAMRIPPGTKVSKDIFNGDIGDWALNGNMASVVVQYPKGLSGENVVSQLRGTGDVHVDELYQEYNIIYARTDINNVYELAKLPCVQHVSLIAEPGEPEDTEGRTLHRSNRINSDVANGLKYDGTGVSVLTRDDGVVGPHIDYKGRLNNLQTAGFVNTDHADMVSGIFVGGGNLDPRAQGMASGANLYVVNYVDHFMDNTLNLHQQRDVMVTNSSYSNGCNDGYTSITRTVDDQIEQNPSFLHVFSAGNSGTRDCGYGAGNRWGNITGGHKIGKNVIATANLRIDVSLENSSSRGPATDGRIKPDLAARGTDQLSTDPENLYSPGGGTSAASPGVAGVSAQLYHAYRDLNNGEDPESALIKAALMNTANDLGNEGPDFLYGWGHINAYRAYKLLQEKRFEKSEVQQAEESIHDLEVPEDVKELRIMLYWREPAASPGSGVALINDLDLTVTDANDNEYLPWYLDPTPDPVGLNQPATSGRRDSLNNVEQVLIRDPEAGNYTVKVRGYSLPFGKREYYVVYEMITEEITVTYPSGGEGFAPSSTQQIHWDAVPGPGSFDLEYSTDDGASWVPIATINGSFRTYNWLVPNEVSSKCHIRVTRGNATAMNQNPFSILGTPLGIRANRVCPSYVELMWNEVEGAGSYIIYMLGETAMEEVITVDTAYAQVPVEDVLGDLWFSVRATGPDGLRSSRSVAVQHNEGLMDCQAITDVGIVRLLSPNENLVYSCDTFREPIVLELRNNGQGLMEDVTLNYQLDNGIVMSETININLGAGETQVFVSADDFVIPTSGEHSVKVWIEAADDELPGNDVVERVIDVQPLLGSAQIAYSEDFEGQLFPPIGYEFSGDVNVTNWQKWSAIGPTGQSTQCASIFNEATIEIFYEDKLFTEAIDLTSAQRPILYFDYAYHVDGNSDYRGVFKIDIYSFCGERRADRLIERKGDQMITSPAVAQSPWTPTESNHWKRLGFDLSEYAGSKIVIAFVMENGFNTNLHLDNINVEESTIDFPQAEMTISNETPCALFEAVSIEAVDPNPEYDYIWTFGERSVPNSATGSGPHVVRFLSPLTFDIQMEVIDAESGAFASSSRTVDVSSQPTPNFSYNVNANRVTFDNRSSRSDSYLWEFGDGEMSTEENPVHTYQETGTFTVALYATSPCTTRVKEEDITIGTVRTTSAKEDQALNIWPNPASGWVLISGTELSLEGQKVEAFSMSGQRISVVSREVSEGIELNIRSLNQGVYLIKLKDEEGNLRVGKLIVQ